MLPNNDKEVSQIVEKNKQESLEKTKEIRG